MLVNLKANIWSFRIGSNSSSMDYEVLVYKVQSCTEFFIEFSCVNPI